MTDNPAKRDPLRYRLYYWLMNASLASSLLVIALTVAEYGLGIPLSERSGTFVLTLGAVTYALSAIVPFFLMVFRFMRDDYTESLWKRTVVVLAYAVAIAPLLVLLTAWIAYFTLVEGTAAYIAWNTFYEYLYVGGSSLKTLTNVWTGYMMLFVAIFQYLRWKDSR